MRKTFIVLFFLLALSLASSQAIAKTDFVFAAGSYRISGEPYATNYNGALLYKIGAEFSERGPVSVELAGEYYLKIHASDSSKSLLMIPLTITGKLNAAPHQSFSPYIGGGFGEYYVMERSDSGAIETITVKDWIFGYHVCAGADIALSRFNSLNIEARQNFVKVNSGGYKDLEIGGLTILAGLKINLVPLPPFPPGPEQRLGPPPGPTLRPRRLPPPY